METIRGLLGTHHRQCDELFARLEQRVATSAWPEAEAALAGFDETMRQHFNTEETVLFPAFEACTGMTGGPTAVMRSEHAQIVELLDALAVAVEARDTDDFSGYAETLHIMVQQHNMKEENILYPMCDQRLAAQADALVEAMRHDIGA